MQSIDLPRHIVRRAEQRWKRTLARQAIAAQERHSKSSAMREAFTQSGRAVPVEVQRSRSATVSTMTRS